MNTPKNMLQRKFDSVYNNIANGMIAIILYISPQEQNVLYNNCQVKMCFLQ